MNRLDVVSTGFPETTKTWIYTQEILKEGFKALTDIVGENAILSGIVSDGSTVTDGVIVYNGEILKFVGSVFNNTISIIETIDNVSYNTDVNDDTVLDVLPAYVTRHATCGTGLPDTASTFAFTDLKNIDSLYELTNRTLPDATEEVKGIAEIATQAEANANTDDLRFITPKKLANRTATTSRKGISAFATSTEVKTGTNATKGITPKALKDAGIVPIKYTRGTLLTNSSKKAYVYPPYGYSMANLKGFIPSIATIYYSGNVDGNDTLTCIYAYESTRVAITCMNSEQRALAKVNYIAIWH